MATSMQFGPEWMRKAPASKSGAAASKESSTSPSAATSPGSGQVLPTSGNGSSKLDSAGAKRNGGISAATAVNSAAAGSPGAFSFAAAAAAVTAQNERNGNHSSPSNSLVGNPDGDASAGLFANGALPKDKHSREKLLSLYSSDRLSRPSPNDLDSIDSSPGPERSSSTSRRKAGTERRPSGFSDFVAGGIGSGAPLSPNLGSSNEPRGLNARSSSGGSTGGFGTTGAFNWERSDRERPGLFQRGSNSALASQAATTANSTTTRPLSPSISRDRFGGIQGGVLSGVGLTSRHRMESSDGSRTTRTNNDDSNGGVWTRAGSTNAFSDAFNSNRARTKTGQGADAFNTSAAGSDSTSRPIVPSANPEGLSISARFARNKERLPGEGPIGPPSDGSIGFGRPSGLDRRRERQVSQAKSLHHSNDTDSVRSPTGKPETGATAQTSVAIDERDEQSSASNREEAQQSHEDDLAQHASSVLGSLKLDDEDGPNFPSTHPAQHEVNNNPYDEQHRMSARQQSYNATPWSPESTFWLYRDMQGNVQGPFNGLMMQDWYSQRYFADDLLIKRQTDAEFWPLAQTVSAIGNALQPFLIPPSNWLHNPDAPTPNFNNMQRAASGANDHDRLASEETWSGHASRQQWSAPLNSGNLNHSTASQTMSPFGRGDPFASLGGFDGRLRTQEDLSALLRERDLLEQRHAGGRSLGQHDVFGSGLGGRSEWGQGADTGVSANNWGLPHSNLSQFDSTGFGAHHSPRASERPAYDAFNQRSAFDQSGSPWASRANAAPRLSTPLSRDAQQSLAHGGNAQQQWAEQQYSHHQQQNHHDYLHQQEQLQQQQQQQQHQQQQQQQVPWSYNQAAPDTPSRQPGELMDGGFRNDINKNGAAPIGTPRRAQSPALYAESPATAQTFEQKPDEQQKSFENAFPAPVEAQTREEPFQPRYDALSTPSKKGKKDLQHQQPATPVSVAAQATPAPVASQPSPEQVVAAEPRPEELWPQSPTAVEFASEPELSGMPEFSLPSKSKDSKREQRSALQRQNQEAGRIVPGSDEQRPSASASRQFGPGNVRVVSQEQFKRGRDQEASAASSQAPLSNWLQDVSASDISSPSASKMAPWAARDDAAATTSAGPTLREIQEAEAKRAEAKRAAEKAAARARMAAPPSANEDLPTSLSWGLASAPASKISASGAEQSAPSSNAPVWNAGKATPKKTLMEIQEEEKKRADKIKAQQTAQAAAMRKAYADSASRSVSGPTHAVPTVNPGPGWSVVGSSGKPTLPASSASSTSSAATPAAVRPALSSIPRMGSSANVPTSMSTSGSGSAWSVVGAKTPATTNGTSATSQPAQVSSLPSLAVRSRSYANDPNAPSPEFLKYLEENMKGLTIKAEDFIEMLLEFPLDPSPDMMEIIAESVYANSSTLDGRRFANDFVTKRKMDVQGRVPAAAKGWSTSTRPSSEIKSQPGSRAASGTVPASIPGSDAGTSGFKVVKKGAKKR